jgi:hypothetical protein
MICKFKFLDASNGGLDFAEMICGPLKERGAYTYENVCSPFRRDRNPSFSFYRKKNSDGRLFINDYGDSTFKGDIFDFAGFYYDLDPKIELQEILERMLEDLDLDANELQVQKKTDGFWQSIDNYGDLHQAEQDAIAHFSVFGISEQELKRHGCTFLSFVPTDEFREAHEDEPIAPFIVKYFYGPADKYYLPYPKIIRYSGVKNPDFAFGIRAIIKRNSVNREAGFAANALLVVAGEKDTMTATSLGYDAVCCNSETSGYLNSSILDIVRSYDHKLIIYDKDDAGIAGMEKLCKKYPGFTPVYLPEKLTDAGGKDISDWGKLGFDSQELIEIIEAAKEIDVAPAMGKEIQLLSKRQFVLSPEVRSIDNCTEAVKDSSDALLDPSLYNCLPGMLKNICSHFEEQRAKDIVLLSSLTVLSSAFPSVKGLYDRKMVGTNMFGFLVAPAGSGKGKAALSRLLVRRIQRHVIKRYEKAMIEYKRNVKDNPEMIAPKKTSFIIPGNTSCAMVYELLDGNGNFGLIHETEADTINVVFKNDWGSYDDLLRKAAMHETISLARVTKTMEVEKPFLSVFLTGTIEQLKKLIPSAENGLFSRFWFYSFTERKGWEDQYANSGIDIEAIFEQYGETVYSWWGKQLDITGDLMVVFNDEQRKKIHNYFSAKLDDFQEQFDIDVDASVKRFGLLHFRICMVLTAIRLFETGKLSSIITVEDGDFNVSLQIMDCLFSHLGKVFGKLKRKEKERDMDVQSMLSPGEFQLYSALPQSFKKSEADSVSVSVGLSNNCYKMLSKLLKVKLINKLAQGKYEKVTEVKED